MLCWHEVGRCRYDRGEDQVSYDKYVKITDFRTNDAFTVRGLKCRLIGSSEILADQGRIELRGNNVYRMVAEGKSFDFCVQDAQDERQLADKMKQYPYNLAGISGKGQNVFFLHIAFFFQAKCMPRFNILLSKEIKQMLSQKRYVKENTLETDVQANFLLSDGTSSCYAVTIGKYDSHLLDDTLRDVSDAEDDNGNADENDEFDVEKNDIKEAFDLYRNAGKINRERKTIVLYGKEYAFRVKLAGDGENSFFYVDSVDTRMRYIPPMALYIGNLTFSNGEKIASEIIQREVSLTHGYLDVWDRYTSIEGDFLLQKARKIGLIHFDRQNISYSSGGFIVYPKGLSDEQRRLLSEGDTLLVAEQPPVYITNEEMTWKEYKKWLDQGETVGENPAVLTLDCIEKDGFWHLTCKDSRTFPPGEASLSLIGNMLQIMRRESARERIANGEAANPALGLLIEGKKSPISLEPKKQTAIEPLSALVKEKLFPNREPRERQKEAIRIALNTPDIALIQGPPGTGKTTVITAIVERLNEEADKRQNWQGQVLLTSFQHDVVRNVIERLRINSLPTPKYGRQGAQDQSQDQAIEQWRLDYVERLKKRNPEIRQTEEQKEFFRLRNAYLISPSKSNALQFLEYARKLNTDNYLASDIDRLTAEISVQESDRENSLLTKIRRIRTTRQGFLDDGPEMADDVLMKLETILSTSQPEQREILDVLEEAADSAGKNVDEELLERLAKVRRNLLSRCTPKPLYRTPQPDPAVLAVYERMKNTLSRPQDKRSEILYDLLNEMENNAEDAENVIGRYSFAYAATAQQSEGRDIKQAKGIRKHEHPEYDTVIIDEAARVNPGDLIVPMSQAKRRIILVGDHRQLPHIYDEEIFESMRSDGNEISKEIVTRSMFEYIKEKLEALEQIDHIPRTITLDAQYRMHPVLGEFVNQNFYAPHGEGFESPLGEEYFRQSLSPKPYLWIDLPYQLGNEQRKSVSRQRECEADCIVRFIQDYMNSPEGTGLTYGVITFYRAQKDMISNKLRRAGLQDKVRVGSVDAFQGMEFDVIFLSAVRTHQGMPVFEEALLDKEPSALDRDSEESTQWLEYRERIGMRYYGRLVSENLLCVALSRQKKLLIVVGDAAIFHKGKWGILAEKCVPAMRNFYELCEKGGMIIHGNA